MTNFSNYIFSIRNQKEFVDLALEVFKYQAVHNQVYARYLNTLKVNYRAINHINKIPFLPIGFFKEHSVITGDNSVQETFISSGTTDVNTSKHYITDISLYERSFRKCFEIFYGHPESYCILALLPSYLERQGSSLIYMVKHLISDSQHRSSNFYLYNFHELASKLYENEKRKNKTLLIGVSFALLEFARQHPVDLGNTVVMETGGMKGKQKEITRYELHNVLKEQFNIKQVHSEYGMTELLSQAYSKDKGIFNTPPWMKIMIRDINDPFSFQGIKKTGGINIIDLANINSCSFIETRDIGRLAGNGSFEVLGRYDNSDVRGCSLLI